MLQNRTLVTIFIVIAEIVLSVGLHFVLKHGFSLMEFSFTDDPILLFVLGMLMSLAWFSVLLIAFVRIEKKWRKTTFYYANAIVFLIVGIIMSLFLPNLVVNSLDIPEPLLELMLVTLSNSILLISFNIGLRNNVLK